MIRFLIVLFCASTAVYGNAILATSPATLGTSEVFPWSELGGSQGPVGSTFVWWPTGNQYIDGSLPSGPGTIVLACSTCAWQPNAGLAPGDSLLLTASYAASSSSLTLNVSPTYGLGAYIQAGTLAGDSGTQFSINIQAFEGLASVLNTTVTSDLAGDPQFVGVADTSAAITEVIFTLTDASGNPIAGTFALDSLNLAEQAYSTSDSTTAPEPGVAYLLGSGIMLLLFSLQRRNSHA